MSSSPIINAYSINNFPVYGKSPQMEIITINTLSLIGLLISDIVSHIVEIEAELVELTAKVDYLLQNAVTSVVSLYDPSGPCPGNDVVDLYELGATPNPGSGVQLGLRPLISTDASVTITYNPICKFIDLKANSSATLTDHWSSGVDGTTGSRVIRYNLLNPAINGNESLLIGVQELNTPTSRQMFYDLYNTGSFRVGGYSGTEWFVSNMGILSFAAGQDTIALGSCSFAGGGTSNSVLGDNSAIFGLSNLIDAENGGIFGGSYNSITGGASDNGVIVGGTNNTFDVCGDSAIIGGSGLSGQCSNTIVAGSNAIIGLGSITGGPVTAPISGSFGVFDASQTSAYYLDKDNTCKLMFKNGFVRGGGSRSYDDIAPTQIGNDGAREVYYPFRYQIPGLSSKTFTVPVEENQMFSIQGSVSIAASADLSKRGYFTFQDGVFTRVGASPTVTVDVSPTITKIMCQPVLSQFSISDIVFSTSGTNITVTITAAGADNLVVNVSLYMYDLLL